MADLGFPKGCANRLFDIFSQNCIKMKEFGPRGGRDRLAVVDSRMGEGTPPLRIKNFLDFMQFLGKSGKFVC